MTTPDPSGTPFDKSRDQLKAELDPTVFRVAFEGGTERAFTGKYHDEKRPGQYRCAVCGSVLFDSDDKYDSGSGWPSYTRPVRTDAVETKTDHSHGMIRTEVACKTCGAHLGHVFEDGPSDCGGMRYCINSAVLDLKPRPEQT